MEKKQDWNSFLSNYGPDNPEPSQYKDSAKTNRQDLNSLHAAEEYIEGKN